MIISNPCFVYHSGMALRNQLWNRTNRWPRKGSIVDEEAISWQVKVVHYTPWQQFHIINGSKKFAWHYLLYLICRYWSLVFNFKKYAMITGRSFATSKCALIINFFLSCPMTNMIWKIVYVWISFLTRILLNDISYLFVPFSFFFFGTFIALS